MICPHCGEETDSLGKHMEQSCDAAKDDGQSALDDDFGGISR